MKQLSWADFDACVQVLTERYSGRSLNGVSSVLLRRVDGVFMRGGRGWSFFRF